MGFKGVYITWTCFRDGMDGKQHGVFGHDGDTASLNSSVLLLVDCGFIFHKTYELPEGVRDKLDSDVLRYIIPSYPDIPRSLQLLCRDSLRQHYKGRQIHAFAERRTIPPRIRDFILLKPSLKTIQHFFVR